MRAAVLTQCKTTPLSSGDRPGLLLLSDRGIGPERAALPALLAAANAWKSLVNQGLADIPLVVESAQVFETHHVAMLLAAGASAVVPYLAEEFAETEEAGAFDKVRKGMLAGCAKFWLAWAFQPWPAIATAICLNCLDWTRIFAANILRMPPAIPARKTLDSLLQDYLHMHAAGYGGATDDLADHGLYRFRKGAELHATSPELVRRMHAHVRKPEQGNYSAFEQLAKAEGPTFLRDLLEMLPEQPVCSGRRRAAGIDPGALQHASHVTRLSEPGSAQDAFRSR